VQAERRRLEDALPGRATAPRTGAIRPVARDRAAVE
jgi:hypothetical protein